MSRREEIVDTVLGLLADTPLEKISTRQVARALGVSQPALFRHFRSREDLLVAVVAAARAALAAEAEQILRRERSGLGRLRALARVILEHVERNPGLPRLIFGRSASTGNPLATALRHLVAMQRAAVRELYLQGRREGSFAAEGSPDRAASVFIGTIQGTVLQWELAGRPAGLSSEADPLFDLWLHGVSSRGEPAPAEREAPGPALHGLPPPPVLRELDVRPLIDRGEDPLETILAALDETPRGSVLLIRAPFRPAPLIALLEERGHGVEADPVEGKEWAVEVAIGDPEIVDLRDLEAPEPLERVLEAASAMRAEETFLARVPRMPRALLPILAERGIDHQVMDRGDRGALVLLRAEP